jgi:hypothetical protein
VFEALLEKIARGLDGKNIPYMVIGGQAVLLYGEPRLTKDIDITLGAGIERLADMQAIVGHLGLKCLTEKVEDFVKETMVFPAIDEKSGIRVDFIFSFSPYEKQAIERAKNIPLGQSCVRFAALEDVVIHKMIAGRPRDIEDVENMLLKNPGYDALDIERWLTEFDAALNQEYARAFAELRKRLT